MHSKLRRIWSRNKGFFVFIALMFVFRSSIADWNHVPTGSMLPTIVEGDRIVVNKMAYDLRVPFTHISMVKLSDPQRGDIVVFDSQANDLRMVKRVIAVPGDSVSLGNNQLVVNGEVAEYVATDVANEFLETIDGHQRVARISPIGSYLDTFRTVVVPQGQYFVMGDNRDNSADSRVVGFIPRSEIVGRSRSMAFSLQQDNYYIPRSDRYLQAL